MGKLFAGFDPGVQGGMAVVSEGKVLSAIALEDLIPQQIWDWVTYQVLKPALADQGCQAVLEHVWGYVGEKVGDRGGGQPGSHMFRLGESSGYIEMALVSAGVYHRKVIPRTWQETMGVAPKGKTETQAKFKTRLKDMAASLYPGFKVNKAVSDAILIASYAESTYRGR